MIDLKLLSKKSIGIIGIRGIGSVYLRELSFLGLKKLYIFGKSYKSTIKNKKQVEKYKNLKILACKSLQDLKSKKLDILCICSPTNTHLIYIKKFLTTKTKIIVEKPLFWENNFSLSKSIKINQNLFDNYPKKFLTNLPMIEYAKSLQRKFKIDKHNLRNIYFKYYTSGKNFYKNIAVDLLPHALCFLLYFYNLKPNLIKIKSIDVKRNLWKSVFYYKTIKFTFDFNQNVKRKNSLLRISLNNKHYLRQQKNNKSKLNKSSEFIKSGKIIKKIENPMSKSILNNLKKLLRNEIKLKDINIQKSLMILMLYFIKKTHDFK